MKITYLVSDDTFFLTHRFSLAKAAQSNGYKITVIAKKNHPDYVAKIKQAGFNFIDLAYRTQGLSVVGDFRVLLKLIKLFRLVDPDIVHAISIRMSFLAIIAFYFCSAKKFVGTITGLGYLGTSNRLHVKLVKKVILLIYRCLLLTKKAHIIVQNKDDYVFVNKNLINKNKMSLILGSGVNLQEFPIQPIPDDTKPIIVTMVSRMLIDKGVLDIIAAAKLLKQQNDNRVIFRLVGDIHPANPNSLSRDQLKQWNDLGLIKWDGPQTDIQQVWSSSHVAILPSFYGEGLPKALLEAASSARPIITTDAPGCREVVQEGKNGYLVPIKSPKAIVEAVLKFVNHPELIQSMGQHSRQLVEQYFSDTIVNAATLNTYL